MNELKENKKFNKVKYGFVVCPDCGYYNIDYKIRRYGSCLKCGKVLSREGHFKRAMIKKLNLYRYDNNLRGKKVYYGQ